MLFDSWNAVEYWVLTTGKSQNGTKQQEKKRTKIPPNPAASRRKQNAAKKEKRMLYTKKWVNSFPELRVESNFALALRRVMIGSCTFSANQKPQKANRVAVHACTFPPLLDSRQFCLLPWSVIQINPFLFGSGYAHLSESLAILLNCYSLQGCSQALQEFAKSKMAAIGGIGIGIAILQVIFYITIIIQWSIIIITVIILLVMFCITITHSLERFSNDCRKTKTKAITPTNHNRSKQRGEPITIPRNYL